MPRLLSSMRPSRFAGWRYSLKKNCRVWFLARTVWFGTNLTPWFSNRMCLGLVVCACRWQFPLLLKLLLLETPSSLTDSAIRPNEMVHNWVSPKTVELLTYGTQEIVISPLDGHSQSPWWVDWLRHFHQLLNHPGNLYVPLLLQTLFLMVDTCSYSLNSIWR